MTPAPTELKPCPFCGGKATLKYSPGFGWEQPPDKSLASISCRKCGTFHEYVETEKAIAAWNTRAPAALEPQAVDDAMVERMRAALRPFSDAVFNDNGDLTVDFSSATYDDFVRAHFAYRALQAAKEPSHD